MNKMSLKPSKPVSAGAVFGLFFMLLFGIGFAVVVGNVLSENDASPLFSILFYLVIIIWIITVLFMLIYHFTNLKSTKGLPLFDINSETGNDAKETARSPMQSLRELESLKKEGLISEQEYIQKRGQILEERW